MAKNKKLVLNSISSPMRLDSIFTLKLANGKLAGTLYISLCPGKKQSVTMSGVVWDRDLEEDIRVIRQSGVNTIACLIPMDELNALQLSNYFTIAEKMGIEIIWFPFQDRSAPPLEGTSQMMNKLTNRLMIGESILLHCKGGLGRAPTIAACLLCHHGTSATEAIKMVKAGRKGSLRNRTQIAFIKRYPIGGKQ